MSQLESDDPVLFFTEVSQQLGPNFRIGLLIVDHKASIVSA